MSAFDAVTLIYIHNFTSRFSSSCLLLKSTVFFKTDVLQRDMCVTEHASEEVPCIDNHLLIRCVTVAFKLCCLIYSHCIFFTNIILSWKHKYKQTFVIACSVIVTNSEPLIRVFSLINTADSMNVPWFRLTLVDRSWN